MIDSYIGGNVNEAMKMHLKLLDIFDKLFMTANPIPVKAALNILGLDVGITRLPLAAPSDIVNSTLKDVMSKLGLL